MTLLFLCVAGSLPGAARATTQAHDPLRGSAGATERRDLIRQAAAAKQTELEREGEAAVARLLGEFYEARNYGWAWSDAHHLTAARDLLVRVSASHEDGLCPMRYGMPWLRDRLARHSGDPWDTAAASDTAASLDVDLTAALLRYVVHLSLGHRAAETLTSSARGLDVLTAFEQLRDPASIAETLSRLQVPHPEYVRLRRALADYRRIVLRGGWEMQKEDLWLEPGDTADSDTLQQLARRLQVSRDLATPSPLRAAERTYEGGLVDAVRRFQRRHGLVVDGIVGPATVAALNVPAATRLAQIEINMDRWRRLPDDLGTLHVRVNIPAFTVRVAEENRFVMQMRAIVGTPRTPTPAFSDGIEYLEFNPYWNVPASIVRNELAPQAAEDPSGLIERGFEVLEGWHADAEMIDPFAVDWESASFDYRVRQQPGPTNSLGLVKFMFPNRYSVYLHDTPGRHLFQRNTRALSHGCVRVEKPARLAEVLLAGGGWPRERIQAAMADGRRRVVPLPAPIPVHLLYLTAWVAPNDVVHFRDDVYGRDRTAGGSLQCRSSSPNPQLADR